MKKMIFLAIFTLFTVSGLSAASPQVKHNFENEFVLKPNTFTGDVVLQKEETISLNKMPSIVIYNYKRLPEIVIQKNISEGNNCFKSISGAVTSLSLKDTFTRFEIDKNITYNKNNVLFGEKPDKLNVNPGFSENYKTIWQTYSDYLKENSWRINVKQIKFEQLLEFTVQKT